MMSLKGQIWPGMGKMDLANEEMKRTRNQRKPTSVIERMRRTSEGIEPTQVVLTSDFEVDRVKGVYDDSDSPPPGQEDEVWVSCSLLYTVADQCQLVTRKNTRAKRKKPTALAEISVNVPRGGTGRRGTAQPAKVSKPKLVQNNESNPDQTPYLGNYRLVRDVFQDEDAGSGMSTLDNRK